VDEPAVSKPYERKRAVVPGQAKSFSDGGIDRAGRRLRRRERDLERRQEVGTDLDLVTGVLIQPYELRVGAKAATGEVDGVELADERRAGLE
jgi:hypothetical protein